MHTTRPRQLIMLRALLVSVLLCGAIATNATETIAVFDEEFDVEYTLPARGLLVGRSSWLLDIYNDHLVYAVETKAVGLAALFSNDHILESSRWLRIENVLRPHQYRYDRSGGRKEKQVTVDFNWRELSVTNTSHGKTWEMAIPDNAIDKMSYVIAMMQGLEAGQRSFEYAVADGGKLKQYTLEVTGNERVATTLGEFDTMVVLRRRSDSDRETTFWCAPRLRHLPIRVEHREPDGEGVGGNIESVTKLGNVTDLTPESASGQIRNQGD